MKRFRWSDRLLYRLCAATGSHPTKVAWVWAVVALCVYGVMYVPFAIQVGFLKFQPELNSGQWVVVSLSALWMPGIVEELIFRAVLVPHPTEPMPPIDRQQWIVGSWVLFMGYHLLPWTPRVFHEVSFLLGAGLLGILCTGSYLQSRSIWTAIFIHWMIVVQWLLVWGGLEKLKLG